MTEFKDLLTLDKEDEKRDAGDKDEDETDTEDAGNELRDQVNNTTTQDLKLKNKKQNIIKNNSDEENLDEKKALLKSKKGVFYIRSKNILTKVKNMLNQELLQK